MYAGFSMIAYLRGRILEKHPTQVIVDAGGVGYDVTIPVSTYSVLGENGSEIALRIYTHVREDTIALFGFGSAEERILFERLIAVSGIGPKLAITILSGLPASELVAAIRSSAIDQLVRIPGIGKKTAERLVVELRDKLDLLGGAARAAAAPKSEWNPIEDDVLSALMNFGATRAAAEAAITKARSAGESNEFEPLFRRALKLVR
jgi:Holliday junction DNA helicase RuvA